MSCDSDLCAVLKGEELCDQTLIVPALSCAQEF